MARKLKSDRVLFLTTIGLVCLSIVMVYSASAVVALERYHQPFLFLTKQVLWAVGGTAVLGLVMRVDYRVYREPAFIWSARRHLAGLRATAGGPETPARSACGSPRSPRP